MSNSNDYSLVNRKTIIGINDKRTLRRSAAQALKKSNNKMGRKGEDRLRLVDIDQILRGVNQESNDHVHVINQKMPEHLFVLEFLTFGTMSIAMALRNEHSKPLIPDDWLEDKNNIPDPNFVFRCLIMQVNNYARSVLNLVVDGVDNAARILLRSTLELMWQTLALLYDRDDYSKYVKGNEFEEGNKIWFELFARGKLQKKLAKIDQEFGVGGELYGWRKSLYSDHSLPTHHTFLAVTAGLMAWDFDKDMGIERFSGGPSSASKRTMTDLIWELWYFQTVFVGILNKKLGRQLDLDDDVEFTIACCRVTSFEIVRRFCHPQEFEID